MRPIASCQSHRTPEAGQAAPQICQRASRDSSVSARCRRSAPAAIWRLRPRRASVPSANASPAARPLCSNARRTIARAADSRSNVLTRFPDGMCFTRETLAVIARHWPTRPAGRRRIPRRPPRATSDLWTFGTFGTGGYVQHTPPIPTVSPCAHRATRSAKRSHTRTRTEDRPSRRLSSRRIGPSPHLLWYARGRQEASSWLNRPSLGPSR
jgi:hypothetical protein